MPLLLLALTIVLAIGSTARAQSALDRVDRSLEALERASGAPIRVTRSAGTGYATFVATDPARPARLATPVGARAEDAARALLALSGEAFGLQGADATEVLSVSDVDDVGMVHVRLRQVHEGVPVRGGELTVHLRGRSASAVNGRVVPDLSGIETVPDVAPDAALDAARDLVTDVLGIADATFSAPSLEILNAGFLQGGLSESRLAWFVEARAAALRELIWVDARNGKVELHLNQLTDAFDRRVHTAGNTSALPGTLVRSEGGPPTGDPDADAAYDVSGDALGVFATEYDRDSFDDDGAPVISTVHFCESGCPTVNAYWNGSQLIFGEGFSQADDVVGHEFAHAVTEHSANLVYCAQPGALNESFSDIFGEQIDLGNLRGDDTAAVRWLIGEDIPGGGALRSMIDPGLHGQPARVSNPEFFCTTGCTAQNDWGGVHFNSGVPNHAFALMVDGGTYDGHVVNGIGLAKSGRVAYRTLTNYLTSTSDFADAHAAFQQACNDLVGGPAGVTVGDCLQVKEALDAVEMHVPACVPNVCGDGYERGDETCDDGNLVDGDGCDSNCTPTACGNGITTALEQCDDANAIPGDGCENACTITPGCALAFSTDVPHSIPDLGSRSSTLSFPDIGRTGVVQVVELRGTHTFMRDLEVHLESPSGTDVAILSEACGSDDGFRLTLADAAATEVPCPPFDAAAHRPSNPLAAFVGDASAGTWTLTLDDLAPSDIGSIGRWGLLVCPDACGDGAVEGAEECDDSNHVDGDGCDSDCTFTGCGNGIATTGEACDDGNAIDGDGCEDDCTLTPGCTTIASGDAPRDIPAVGSTRSLLFSPLVGSVTSVRVLGLRGTHSYVGDLDIRLVSPTGTEVPLLSHVCGASDDFDLDLSDSAATPVPCAPTDGGEHRPAGTLSSLDGESAAGVWELRIDDTAGDDAGRLEAWSLSLCTDGCPTGAPDADGDGVCDAFDPCNDTGAQTFASPPRAKLKLSRVHTETVPANEDLKLSGSFDLPVGSSFDDLDFVARGARVVLETAAGARMADVTLPAGAYAGARSRGWLSNGSGTKWTYLDRTGSPRNGVTKMSILRKSNAAAPRRVKVDVRASGGLYPVATSDPPPRATIVLGDETDGAAGRCGESAWAPSDCRFAGAGSLLLCKR